MKTISTLFVLLVVTRAVLIVRTDPIQCTQNLTDAEKLAMKAAAGLENRKSAQVYTIENFNDIFWHDVLGVTGQFIDAKPFLKKSLQKWGTILYNDTAGIDLLPSVVTLAGVFDLIPVTSELQKRYNTTVKINTLGWSPLDALGAVRKTLQVINETSTLAVQEPAFLASGQLVDWIVSQKLFTVYMKDQCIPLTDSHSLLKEVIDLAPWPRPIKVYGYNFQNLIFGADPWEAETDCNRELGQIASSNSTNLSFWKHFSIFQPKESLKQPVEQPVTYNANTTYVALVYGDLGKKNAPSWRRYARRSQKR